MIGFKMRAVLIFGILLSASLSLAAGYPACKDKKRTLEFNQDMLLNYRDQMEPKFKTRGFIKGTLIKVIEDRQRHVHFEVDLDGDAETSDDRIEVIYNTSFGSLPDYGPGAEIIACGDFIVDPYSPLKAVLHWLHHSPKQKAHDDGYLVINGQVLGLRQ
ncbi:DUF3465 domain-containing protein [Bdellovibrio bacteriovorus]|nr:DUF3465 domain-containing protein [Bdellovibrio bacteriovorus]